MARRSGEVVTECGCMFYPGPLLKLLGENAKSAYCGKHGWQVVTRNATTREIYSSVIGNYYDSSSLSDDPPF